MARFLFGEDVGATLPFVTRNEYQGKPSSAHLPDASPHRWLQDDQGRKEWTWGIAVTTVCVPGKASGIANVFAFHTSGRFPFDDQATSAERETSPFECHHDLAGQLDAMKIPAAAVQVLALAPLAYAAWFDGTLSASKRELALKAITQTGISAGSISYRLLDDWLCHRPDPALMTAWYDYVGALKWILSEESLNRLQQTTIERSQAVLRATSCCFGIGQFADNQHMVLNRINAAF